MWVSTLLQYQHLGCIWITEDIFMGSYLLSDRLTVQRYRDFMENGLSRMLWRCVSSCGACRSSRALWGRLSSGSSMQHIEESGLTSRINCTASPVARSNVDFFFLWEHLKEHVYAAPSRITEDFQASVTTVDANTLRQSELLFFFWALSIVRYTKKTKGHNISENGSVSVLR
jgi:hypothetical protein